MEFFRIHKTIPFMHYRHVLNLISLVSFIVAVFWIFTHGLAFSIEFTGGTQMEAAIRPRPTPNRFDRTSRPSPTKCSSRPSARPPTS